MNTRPPTLKDVARLAGASTATVSRVVNVASEVTCETRAKVLDAISSLQYRANAHTAELGRANGGLRRKHNNHLPTSTSQKTKLNSAPETDAQSGSRQRGRLRSLEDEYSRARHLVSCLLMDLEKLRSIAQKCQESLNRISAKSPLSMGTLCQVRIEPRSVSRLCRRFRFVTTIDDVAVRHTIELHGQQPALRQLQRIFRGDSTPHFTKSLKP